MSIINDFEEYLNREFPLPEMLTKPLKFDEILDQGIDILNKDVITGKIAERAQEQDRNPAPATRTSANFVLEGVLSEGRNTRYSIHGKDLKTSSNTWIFGDLRLGCRVKAKGVVSGNERVCTSIVVYGER